MATSLLTDDKGNLSSMRLVNLVIVFIVMAVWVYICWNKKEFVAFDQTQVWLIGVTLFGKVAQKGIENISTFNIQSGS